MLVILHMSRFEFHQDIRVVAMQRDEKFLLPNVLGSKVFNILNLCLIQISIRFPILKIT